METADRSTIEKMIVFFMLSFMILIPVKFCAAKVLHFTHKGGQFFAKTVDLFA